MKKKLIGLSILLAVLLLGLSTISYANISEVDIKNYAVYIGVNKGGKTEQYMIDWLETATWTNFYNAISSYIDNDNYDVFLYSQGSEIYFYYRASNISSKIYIRDMSYYSVTAPNFNGYRVNTISTSATNFSIYNSQYVNNLKANSFYTDLPIYSSSSYTSITFPGGTSYPSSAIFDGPFEDSLPFTFVSEPGLGTVMYDNYEYTLFNKPSSGDILLGQLFIPDGIVVNYADVLNHYWYWNNWQVREFSDDSIRTQLVSNNDGNLVFNVFLKRNYIYNNTYYQYIFTSTQTEPYQFVSGGCYIKDSHTVISSGVVDPYNTFSGDYKDEYDSIIDNQQDVNNISEAIGDTILDDSEVDNMLSGFNTSGDILNTLGYSPLENPFSSVILRVMQALNDVLLGSGDVTLDISAFELDMEINSSDFTLPSGLIKNFVSLISNGFVIWLIYKYGFKLYMMINTGKFKNLIDETTNTNVNLF